MDLLKKQAFRNAKQLILELFRNSIPLVYTIAARKAVGNIIVPKYLKASKPSFFSSFPLRDVRTTIHGIIESNYQIIRNESGQTKHREFIGIYVEKQLKKAVDVEPDKPKSPNKWLWIFVLAIIVPIIKTYLLQNISLNTKNWLDNY